MPDYFALFQSMFSPASPAPAAAPNLFAMLDPKELERKIGEMETVLAWLKATTGMLETSLQAMRYQQSVLASLSRQPEPSEAASPPGPDMQELAKFADAMNPALWAFNMMQAKPGEAGGNAEKRGDGPKKSPAKRATKRKS
jgi:hypothetical protein